MSKLLEITNLSKRFGTRPVLTDINLTVAAGSSLAIMGSSGSGKSTLLNIIGMLEDKSGGSVRFNSKELPGINSRQAMLMRRSSINYLFQSFALLDGADVISNILFGMHYAPGSKQQKRAAAADMLERLNIAHLTKQQINTLSGGEQQRVALARCLLKPGELILADEPTGALDQALAQTALKEMLKLQREFGKTLVVVTHDPQVAAACDSTFVLPAAPTQTVHLS